MFVTAIHSEQQVVLVTPSGCGFGQHVCMLGLVARLSFATQHNTLQPEMSLFHWQIHMLSTHLQSVQEGASLWWCEAR